MCDVKLRSSDFWPFYNLKCKEKCLCKCFLVQFRGGHWDFRFCGFDYFLDWFFGFVPKDFGFSLLVFIVVCRFFVF